MRFPSLSRRQVATLPMCYYGHPVLKEQSQDIGELTDDVRELAEQMIATMHKHDGIGLAGNQVGRKLNIVALDIPRAEAEGGTPPSSPGEAMLLPRMPMVVINPTLDNASAETGPYEEGCLSIPNIRGTVVRPLSADLHCRTLDGQTLNVRVGGLLCRCLQHEIDHLNGILFTELISDDEREALEPELQAMKKETLATLKKTTKRRRR